ncbi:MAG: 50S ribosomal protein L6 [Clostridia bacterium]|nr:50S ribosomal protein L6 [Clostridia bacterium]MBQ4586356.1 50S ribosomal protein L6 [Clostridia bacterium]
MSRIGREPVVIPAGVTVDFANSVMTVTGPKGTLTQDYDTAIIPNVEGNQVVFTRTSEKGDIRAKHGLYRALLHNMVVGVTQGFTKSLIVNGVGWKVNMQGEKLILNIGFSHPVEYTPLKGVSISCPSQTEIVVSGINKVDVGQVAATLRAYRKPEPYHGYGIRYKDEVIERKEGKTAGK